MYAPSLELKPLPSHLKYAYLGDNSSLPFFLANKCSYEQEDKL